MVPEWVLVPMYSPLEVVIAIFLAAIPMSRFSELVWGMIEKRTGISVTAENGSSEK